MKKDVNNIIKYGNASIALSLIIPGAYILLTLACPYYIMYPFVKPDNEDYQEIANILVQDKLLLIGGVNLALSSIKMVSAQSLMGAGVTGSWLAVNTSTAWIGVGLGYALAFNLGYGVLGLCLGFGGGLIISATAQGLYWRCKAQALASSEARQPPAVDSINYGLVSSPSPVVAFSDMAKRVTQHDQGSLRRVSSDQKALEQMSAALSESGNPSSAKAKRTGCSIM